MEPIYSALSNLCLQPNDIGVIQSKFELKTYYKNQFLLKTGIKRLQYLL